MQLNFVSWNLHGLAACWQDLADDESVDIALVQEAREPPEGLPITVVAAAPGWRTDAAPNRSFCAAVAVRDQSAQITFRRIDTQLLADSPDGALPVSVPGTLAAAVIDLPDADPITVVSVYSAWESPVDGGGWIYADASAHRLISDLSALIGTQRHRILVAGDWNILHGYGEHGSGYWGRRYQTVFDRMEALGFTFCGPQHPNGRRADPRPDELPDNSLDVPTYRGNDSPAGATRQLDFVFASASLAPHITATAVNPGHVEGWGVSDHCQVRIVVDLEQ